MDYNFDEIFKLFKIELNEKSPSFTRLMRIISSLIQKSFKVYLIHEKENQLITLYYISIQKMNLGLINLIGA